MALAVAPTKNAAPGSGCRRPSRGRGVRSNTTTASRWYRSARKRPALTEALRSVWVAAMSLASTGALHHRPQAPDVLRLDPCEVTYYEAVARAPSGTQLRLMLTDRRSAVRLDCLTNITKGRPPWSVAVYDVDDSAAVQDISVQMPIAYLDGAPDGDDDMQAWRDQRFHDAWLGIIGQRRNPLTAQTHYASTAVEHADAYVLDFDNARGGLQSCGTHFMESVLEPAGVAPLVDQGGVHNITYWRIVQCRRRE